MAVIEISVKTEGQSGTFRILPQTVEDLMPDLTADQRKEAILDWLAREFERAADKEKLRDVAEEARSNWLANAVERTG